MPNWCHNDIKLCCNKKKFKEIVNKYFTNGNFDFNKITPMPDSLLVEKGTITDIAKACSDARINGLTTCQEYEQSIYCKNKSINFFLTGGRPEFQKTFDELADLGDTYRKNKELYGFEDWYDWCCEYWGTKWNASNCEIHDDNSFFFDTPWAPPEPVLKKMAISENIRMVCGFSVEYGDYGTYNISKNGRITNLIRKSS